ncbi:biotin--[acetyl-CoA-carboxylase] ligase [Geothrix sp. 21YS21S-4]|uniref:biotin--[acetyl-CoA-carboxylase] ligase n=1 Tax=Geothrix sp. 21YS21S-4 TaxID=3068889 RepID=UPI0027BA99A0|nr:biotin--[acetyl-CoA-carboxylase] ligase [Geothrix sp. 21YS21S-4]
MAVLLIRLAEVDSTQAFLRRNAHLGFCAAVADRQIEGRGRQGNRWESAPGAGLWLSAALPPPADVAPGILLQRAMAAAARILDPEGKHLGLKWPNDLVAWRDGRLVKLGGILGEQSGTRLILGLGVNLFSAPHLPERAIPPACLKDLGLACPDPAALAIPILHAWNNLEQDSQVLFRWPDAGVPIRWEDGQGTCLGWERDGRLKVTTADGIRRLSAGDVSGLN